MILQFESEAHSAGLSALDGLIRPGYRVSVTWPEGCLPDAVVLDWNRGADSFLYLEVQPVDPGGKAKGDAVMVSYDDAEIVVH